MAARTPLKAKQHALAVQQVSTKPLRQVAGLSPRKVVDAALVFGDRKRKAPDVVNLCTTDAQVPAKVSSPAAKRARVEPSPTVPALERGKKSKARREKDEVLRRDIVKDRAEWQRKYRHAFRKFVFYIDGFDGNKRSETRAMLEELGAAVEDFFSKEVTHVITARPVPVVKPDAMPVDVEADKENAAATLANAAAVPSKPANKRRSPLKAPIPTQQSVEGQDIVSKALSLNMKIWDMKKCHKVAFELLDANSPTKAKPPKQLSLPKLLRDEQLTGITRERDPEVLRQDYHYFPQKSVFVIVEDSSGTHRPVLVKEYTRPRRAEEPEWPVLYGGTEGRTAFSRPPGYVQPAAPTVPLPLVLQKTVVAHSLRKAASLNQLHRRHAVGDLVEPAAATAADAYRRHDEASGFLAASGNSVSLTSNIASVTSGAPIGQNGFAGNGALDKRLAFLDKRQLLTSARSGGLLAAIGVRAPLPLKRSMSIDSGLSARQPIAREHPPKPGYCENCRIRYEDFKEHVKVRRHRKFAQTASNWTSLDETLRRIERPLNSSLLRLVQSDKQLFNDLRRDLRLPDAPECEDVHMFSADEEDDMVADEDDEDDEDAADDDDDEEEEEGEEETAAPAL